MRLFIIPILAFLLSSCATTDQPRHYPNQENRIAGTVITITPTYNGVGPSVLTITISNQGVDEIVKIVPEKEALFFIDESQHIRTAIPSEIVVSDHIIAYEKPSISPDVFPRTILVDEIVIIRKDQ